MSSQMAKISAFQPERGLICASRTPASIAFPASSAAPAMTAARVKPGIVHLGIGAFHRAHQAVVIDDLLAAGATDWGIIGASLRSADTHDALAPQDCLYTVAVRSGAGTEHRIIGSMLDTEVAQNNPAQLIARMADPRNAHRLAHRSPRRAIATRRRPANWTTAHPDIVHDLATRTRRDRRRDSSSPRWRAGATGHRALHGAVLRQSLRQRPHREADPDAVRRAAIAGTRQMDRGRSRLPLDDGGPHRARDHRRRSRRGRGRAWPDRRVACDHRAVHAMDRRRPVSRRPAGFRARRRATCLGCRRRSNT